MKTRVAIYGYGNLGRGVELALASAPDMEAVGVFTRRPPESVKTLTGVPTYAASALLEMKEEIDVVILCGGSRSDLPEQTPALAAHFNVVDSFDTHAKIPEHLEKVDAAARRGGKTALISAGWDPGLFSLMRLLSTAIFPRSNAYTFWGRGVSQGHSDAIRRIRGVKDARQYTVPVEAALASVRAGEEPSLAAREKHTRECFVVAEEGADLARIEAEIKEMPDYFADYDTTVTFVSEETLRREHAALPHGGFVISSGRTGASGEHRQLMEYRLALDSNPEFTSSVLVAYARAVYRLHREGVAGAKTVLDVPPVYLAPRTREEIISSLL